MIEIIDKDKRKDKVQGLLDKNIFLFTYDVCKSAKMNANFPNPGYKISNFHSRAMIIAEVQTHLSNFKNTKKINAIKAYLFCLLGVYLINAPATSIVSTLKKH